MSGNCPLGTCGVWKQDFKRSESLCPFMDGLFPWPLSTVACTVADLTPVTLRIVCKTDNHIEIVDKTTFGRNVTEVSVFKNDIFSSNQPIPNIPIQKKKQKQRRPLRNLCFETLQMHAWYGEIGFKVPIFALDYISDYNGTCLIYIRNGYIFKMP